MENLTAIIEAILFVSGDPVRTDALAHAMNLTTSELNEALAALGDHLALENRGIQLNRLPDGSSAKTTAGLLTNARATATRCFSPPDNSAGL